MKEKKGVKSFSTRFLGSFGLLMVASFVVLSLICGDSASAIYSMSLSTDGAVNLDVVPTVGATVDTDNVVVNSTCPLGYTLSIGGPSDTTLYMGGDSTSGDTINTSTGTVSKPTAIMGEGKLDTWGYSVASGTGISSNTFVGLTNTATRLATSSSASATGGDTVPVHYGASVSATRGSGIYKMANSAGITYYLTANPNCIYFTVQYDGNNANSGTTMSVRHTNVQEDDEINLYPSNYKRAGYGFAGWSTTQINPDAANAASLISAAAANGEIYGPMATITADSNFLGLADNTNTITLYAVWVKPVNNATMQSWTGCSAMNQGEVIALKDQRDNDVYAVAKLADNNCWMIENLRLDYDAEHNADGSLAQGYGTSTTYGNFIGLAEPETTNFSNSTTANSLYKSDGSGDIKGINGATLTDIGTADYPGYRFPRYNNNNTNPTATAANPNTTVADMTGPSDSGSYKANIYSYGNYYTWAAVIANTGYYNTTTVDANGYTPSEAAGTSICPKGWKLPYGRNTGKGATSGGFYNLNYKINNDSNVTDATASNNIRSYPNNLLYSGLAGTTSVDRRGSSGDYWSSTAGSGLYSYSLSLNSSRVSPGITNGSKYYGSSVRCIASTDYTISYDANGGTGTMGDQLAFNDNLIELNANTFTRQGWEFVGWNTAADGSGTAYTNQEKVNNLAAAGGVAVLYAQWNQLSYTVNFVTSNATGINIDGVTYTNGQSATILSGSHRIYGEYATKYSFSSWTTTAGSVASNIPVTTYDLYANTTITLTGQQATVNMSSLIPSSDSISSTCKNDPVTPQLVYDPRDNEAYWVARLCDGNYWMLDNLRLDLADSTTLSNLSTSNTNADEHSLSCLKTGSYNGSACGGQYARRTVVHSDSWAYYVNPLINNTYKNSVVTNFGVGSGRVGVYYNYCAASAGSFCYASGSGVDKEDTYRDIDGDICPAGWHMPTGGDYDVAEYRTLLMSYYGASGGTWVAARNALSANLTGYWDLTDTANYETTGYAWTSTWYDVSRAYRLAASTSSGSANSGLVRGRGAPVRCVMDSQ